VGIGLAHSPNEFCHGLDCHLVDYLGFAGANKTVVQARFAWRAVKNLGFALKEQHPRREQPCESKQSRHSWGSLPRRHAVKNPLN
jgi:hypothetical protein